MPAIYKYEGLMSVLAESESTKTHDPFPPPIASYQIHSPFLSVVSTP